MYYYSAHSAIQKLNNSDNLRELKNKKDVAYLFKNMNPNAANQPYNQLIDRDLDTTVTKATPSSGLFQIRTMTEDQFRARFNTEDACAKALYKAKWPHGFRCPRCSNAHFTKIKTRTLPLFECRKCLHQTSLRAGTVMARSRTELKKWFLAIYLISRESSIKQSINATQLQNILEVTYKTAWLMMSKIRSVISKKTQNQKLFGNVYVHPDVYGRRIHSSLERHKQEHPLLIGSIFGEKGMPIFIKLQQIKAAFLRGRRVTPYGIRTFIKHFVSAPIAVTLNGKKLNLNQENYLKNKKPFKLNKLKSTVQCISQPFSPKRCRKLIDVVRSATRWLNNTYGGIGEKHLQSYLDEFCFRWNLTKSRSSLFHSLYHLCTTTTSPTYAEITRQRDSVGMGSSLIL